MGVILIDRTDRLAASVTKVSTVFLRHSHHSRHSGYRCLTDRLGAFADARQPPDRHLPLELLADRAAREDLRRRARARAEARDLTAGARRHGEIYASLLP
jgi:hypothetical protein